MSKKQEPKKVFSLIIKAIDGIEYKTSKDRDVYISKVKGESTDSLIFNSLGFHYRPNRGLNFEELREATILPPGTFKKELDQVTKLVARNMDIKLDNNKK